MKTVMRVIGLAAALGLVGRAAAGESSDAAKKVRPDPDVRAVAKSNTHFALALCGQMSRVEKGNFFFSSTSVHTVLTMTFAGARGRTAEGMARALALPGGPGGGSPERSKPWTAERLHAAYGRFLAGLKPPGGAGYELRAANALWGRKDATWLPGFLAVMKRHYGAALREADFAGDPDKARRAINTWVAEQTRRKITDLIQRGGVDALTALVLVNAVYFKGDWACKFDPARTSAGAFHVPGGKTVQAAMMWQLRKLPYAEDGAFQLLAMPYKGSAVSMLILLPKRLGGGVPVPRTVAPRRLSALVDRLKVPRHGVRVTLPRFTIHWQAGLKLALIGMGMGQAFIADRADFSGMSGKTGKKELFISAVVHKALVDVNEEGTEAAAATAVRVAANGHKPKTFRADHPFLFFIRHNPTGAILFVGRVTNPGESPRPEAKTGESPRPEAKK